MRLVPIFMNTEMVNAKIAGRKKQTRRLKGLERFNINPDAFTLRHDVRVTYANKGILTEFILVSKDGYSNWIKCPYNVGDTLWVRETWAHGSDSLPYIYKAGYPQNVPSGFDNIPDVSLIKWKPSIHMPREACRLESKISQIKLERLQSISICDCIDEGIEPTGCVLKDTFYANYGKEDYGDKLLPYHSFKTLWRSIHGYESWALNPWVWKLEFERTK